ncbi:MAG: hypothetical protein A2X64_01665 [Ignavibacteria bacterium GWF2_33_9]|nr:MAG: hypothetical protein A2X64_01665 [Ignavibacteria bacterium GWF2_33_9]
MNETKIAYLSFVIYSVLQKPALKELSYITKVKEFNLAKWKKQFKWNTRKNVIFQDNLCFQPNEENDYSARKVVQSLQKLFDGVIRKLSLRKNEIESMDLDAQLKTMQSLSKTIQSLIKILEIKDEISDSDIVIQKFTEQILSNSSALALAEQLLEILSEEDFSED